MSHMQHPGHPHLLLLEMQGPCHADAKQSPCHLPFSISNGTYISFLSHKLTFYLHHAQFLLFHTPPTLSS